MYNNKINYYLKVLFPKNMVSISWKKEGIVTFIGSHTVYNMICIILFSFDSNPASMYFYLHFTDE